jgi:hypothetical protein
MTNDKIKKKYIKKIIVEPDSTKQIYSWIL